MKAIVRIGLYFMFILVSIAGFVVIASLASVLAAGVLIAGSVYFLLARKYSQQIETNE